MMELTEIFAGQQGEGPDIGKTTIFVRFNKCNIRPYCSFCDVRNYKASEYSLKEVIGIIDSYKNIGHITFSGGEPSVYLNDMKDIMSSLPLHEFSVETNGLKFIDPEPFKYVVCSPKKQCLNFEVIKKYNECDNAYFKFVVSSLKDYGVWKKLILNNKIKKSKVYMMPEGLTDSKIKTMYMALSKICIEDGFNVSPRLHILVYGNIKGV